MQTALWRNRNSALCDILLSKKSDHKPFKGTVNEGGLTLFNREKCKLHNNWMSVNWYNWMSVNWCNCMSVN